MHGRHDLVKAIALFEDSMNRNHHGAVFIHVAVLYQSFLYLGFTALLPDHHHVHAIVSHTAFTCRSSVQSHVIAVWNSVKWILLLVFHQSIPTFHWRNHIQMYVGISSCLNMLHMLVRNYHYSLRNNSEESSSLLLYGRSLKSRMLHVIHSISCNQHSH